MYSGKGKKKWCSTAGKRWTWNIGHSEMMLSKLKSDKGKWYGFFPYYANLTYFPSPPVPWCAVISINQKLSHINPNEKLFCRIAFHTATYSAPSYFFHSTAMLLLSFTCTDFFYFFSPPPHLGVADYNRRLVLTVTELFHWSGKTV